ncbi:MULTISPECIES: hypothetical protein [Kribbella]|uniref:Uncharacterized protein n=1 Tax=Kribbella karoonensis TaxID=324851 RepID=A0ABN2DRK2_9ACTN
MAFGRNRNQGSNTPQSKKGKPQEHDNNQSPSNQAKHERGASRKLADQKRSTNPNTRRGRENAKNQGKGKSK